MKLFSAIMLLSLMVFSCGTKPSEDSSLQSEVSEEEVQKPSESNSLKGRLMRAAIDRAKSAVVENGKKLLNGINVKSCQELDFEKTEVGDRCKTSKGYVFELVSKPDAHRETWKGPDGILWGDLIPSTETNEAFGRVIARNVRPVSGLHITCQNQNMIVPTADHFKKGEKQGIREVLPNIKGNFFWTSTNVGLNHGRRVYVGDTGKLSFTGINTTAQLRCVGDNVRFR